MQTRIHTETFSTKVQRFKMGLFSNKLNHPLILFILALLGFALAAGIALFGIKGGIIFIIAIIGIPLVYATIAHPRVGISAAVIISYFLLFGEKFTEFPVGTIMDGMLGLLVLGFLLKQRSFANWKMFSNPISIVLLIWILYNLLEVANPIAASKLAWLYTIRTVALVLLTHFIFLFHLKTSNDIRQLLKIWIGLSFVAALYGLHQQFFGFFAFEQKWLDNNPTAISLYFIGGTWRKFSIFSDPVTFAYNMVIGALLCISLITGPMKAWKKIVLVAVAGTCLFSMLFSGTRGAYVLFPTALAMLMVLKFNRQIILFGIIAGALVVGLIYMPTSNPTIQRFQSAFYPEEDASFNVRKNNQRMIQPYIQSHPIGGGLGSTGTWGKRFSPDSFLANFPPDSGYVRVAVETGWIGLFLLCTMMFVILKRGISNYYRIKNKQLKSYSLAMILVVFALHIGNYPQEALVQYPTNILFSLACTLMLTTFNIDQEESMTQLKPSS